MKKISLVWVFLTTSTVVFLLHFAVTGQAVYGDGRFYYSYARSLYFDHDLDLVNELAHVWTPENNNRREPLTGQAGEYPVQFLGTGLVWLPAMALGDVVARSFHLPAQGYSDVYQLSVGLYTISLAALGFHFCQQLLRRYFSPRTTTLALLFLYFTTNLFYYTAIDVLNTHPVSWFLAALFLYVVFAGTFPGTGQSLGLGLLAGLIMSVRQPDLLTILPAVSYLLIRERPTRHKLILAGIWIAVGMLVAQLPQLYYWHNYSAGILPGQGVVRWQLLEPKFWELLVSPRRGILYYSPSLLLAIWGLWRRRSRLFGFGLLAFGMQYLLISVWGAWDQGEAYGIRMLISTYPWLLLGYASALKTLRWSPLRFAVLLVTLTLVNFSLIFNFLWRQTGSNQEGLDPATRQRLETISRKFLSRP